MLFLFLGKDEKIENRLRRLFFNQKNDERRKKKKVQRKN